MYTEMIANGHRTAEMFSREAVMEALQHMLSIVGPQRYDSRGSISRYALGLGGTVEMYRRTWSCVWFRTRIGQAKRAILAKMK